MATELGQVLINSLRHMQIMVLGSVLEGKYSTTRVRTNEYWVTQDTDGKGRLTQDTHLPVTKRRPNPRPSRY